MYESSSDGGPAGSFENFKSEGDVLFKQCEYKKALESFNTVSKDATQVSTSSKHIWQFEKLLASSHSSPTASHVHWVPLVLKWNTGTLGLTRYPSSQCIRNEHCLTCYLVASIICNGPVSTARCMQPESLGAHELVDSICIIKSRRWR